MERNIFYVYIYLDPRKPGSFDYVEFYFDLEPFYVGKGHGVQWLVHLGVDQYKTYKSYKLNKIRKIQSLGLEPKIIKYKENLTEQEAFDLEKKLIKAIGRLDLGLGPLTNLTDGGEGFSNPSEEIRQKIAEKLRGRTKENDPSVARMAEKLRGRTKETHPSIARGAEKKRGRTKENDPSVARAAEKKRGRTKETHPGVARMAEKMKVVRIGRTKENDPGVARMAEKKTGRTKENDPSVARMAEKMKGRTKENDLGKASMAEKMKIIMKGNKNGRRKMSVQKNCKHYGFKIISKRNDEFPQRQKFDTFEKEWCKISDESGQIGEKEFGSKLNCDDCKIGG